jgi:halogenation protein CepH
MIEERCDVVVIGGGPGGSSAATMLAKAGLEVILLERERFPRFHIGESLLPGAWELWTRLGAIEKLEAEGFPPKQGINFGMFNKPPEDDVVLLTAEYPRYFELPYAFHVERARFDEIMLDHSASCGADVRQQWTVKEVLFEGDRAVGVLAGPNGAEPHPIRARMVVDASGRDSMLAKSFGWRKPDPELNKVAHFTHFHGGWRRDPTTIMKWDDVLAGSTTTDIHTIDSGWIWFIPLKNDIVSVGTVLDARKAKTMGANPQERFEAGIESCVQVREWVKGAKQTMEMHTISSISYLNECFVGNGFCLVGDASMFIDPIFSAGVTIATRGGVYASDTILECFKHNDFSAERLKAYENRIRIPMSRIFKMIYNWYRILEMKDANNIILRARKIPMLRDRFITLLSGGYEKVDMEAILQAAGEPDDGVMLR